MHWCAACLPGTECWRSEFNGCVTSSDCPPLLPPALCTDRRRGSHPPAPFQPRRRRPGGRGRAAVGHGGAGRRRRPGGLPDRLPAGCHHPVHWLQQGDWQGHRAAGARRVPHQRPRRAGQQRGERGVGQPDGGAGGGRGGAGVLARGAACGCGQQGLICLLSCSVTQPAASRATPSGPCNARRRWQARSLETPAEASGLPHVQWPLLQQSQQGLTRRMPCG